MLLSTFFYNNDKILLVIYITKCQKTLTRAPTIIVELSSISTLLFVGNSVVMTFLSLNGSHVLTKMKKQFVNL